MKLYRNSGWLLVGIGILHSGIGLMMGWPILGDIVAAGVWNSIESGGQIHYDRSAILWFLLTGFFWLLLGYLMQAWLDQSTAPLPRVLGWAFLSIGVVVSFLLPISGAWLFIALGLIVALGVPEPDQVRA